jgi:hypothetical protein
MKSALVLSLLASTTFAYFADGNPRHREYDRGSLYDLMQFDEGPHAYTKGKMDYREGTARGASTERNEASAATTSATRSAGNRAPLRNTSNGNASGIPQNANAGECYLQVLVPPTYETVQERVMVEEASSRIETVPAQYKWVDEEVVVKEATTRVEVIPAEYKTVTERVLVEPEQEKIIEVPATYKWVEEQVLVRPAHTAWKEGENLLEDVDHRTTGEIMCLVEVPAEYKTVRKRVVDTPATTRVETTPARYETVTKTVLVTPERTREVEVPAEYATVKVRKMVSPETSREIEIPAQYEMVERRVVSDPAHTEWRQVVCETNFTPDVAYEIEARLEEAGYNPGPVDGTIDDATRSSLSQYQRDHNLAQGGITMETIRSLDVELDVPEVASL